MNYKKFIHNNSAILDGYWSFVKHDILSWKNSYEWPKNVKLESAIAFRNELELLVNRDLHHYNYLSKKVFDRVIVWGFGSNSNNSEAEIRESTKKAFYYLKQDRIELAAIEIVKMKGIGISRASKVLAISNQNDYGIYDSRSAHGLSDLTFSDKKRIPIPPGRVVPGDDHLNNYDFCYGFQNYTWVLRYLREKALQDPGLKHHFPRVADIEIAFFTRSRLGIKTTTQYNKGGNLFKSMVRLDETFESLLQIISEPSEDDNYRRKLEQALAEVKINCDNISQMNIPDRYQIAGLINKKASENLRMSVVLMEENIKCGKDNTEKIDRYIKKYIRGRISAARAIKYEKIFNIK